MKKFIETVSVLAVIILLLVFAACGGGEKQPSDGATKEATDDLGIEVAQEPSAERMYPNLEAKDFGGYEFTFLTRWDLAPDWAEWRHRDLFADEQTGDVINDAVYVRNAKIEEKYNIKIRDLDMPSDKLVEKTRQVIRAGDDSYDVILPRIVEFAALAQAGMFLDIFQLNFIDLEKPWWNQGTIADLSIMRKLYTIQGDLLIMNNDALEIMVFNKGLLRDFNLDSPYSTVKNGEWTIDKLIEMSRGIAKDLNGDGTMYLKEDRFGCVLTADGDISFLVSGGEKICAKDKDDYPVITFGSERCYSLLEKVSELMLDEDNVVHLHRYEGKFPIYDEQIKMMEEDRVLFSWVKLRLVERLRGMESDFGILPVPKFDKAQKEYITHNNPHSGVGICVPVTSGDPDRAGMVLEDLCAESKYTLQPAYYEINLRGKYARDDESLEMLDIILSNNRHDIGYVYNFGGFAMTTLLRNGQNKKSNYASPFESVYEKMLKDIEKTVEAYKKLGEN